jgi:hypothetical protein
MSALLDFFAAGPARIQALLVAFLAAVAIAASLSCWALWERASAVQARAERDRALDQVAWCRRPPRPAAPASTTPSGSATPR